MIHIASPTVADPPRTRWPLAIVGLWICATISGMWLLWQYAGTPGIDTHVPVRWPNASPLKLNPHGATLVMFAHPHCPCTRASMAELERIVAQCHGAVTPWIVFYKPTDTSEGWEETDLWHRAGTVPGAHRLIDVDGAELRRFHAVTSGQTLLYDAGGKLLFQGGITSARGHEGDNPGKTAIIDLATGGASACRETPAFGCSIAQLPNTP